MPHGIVPSSLITFVELSKNISWRPSVRTIERWALKGIGGVRLQTLKIGRKRVTTWEHFLAFTREVARRTGGRPAAGNHVGEVGQILKRAGL